MTLALVDTAGLRPARDLVEMMGVERSGKLLSEADALILMEEVFHFQPEKPEPAPRLSELRDRACEQGIQCFHVINKLDTVSDHAEVAAIKTAATRIGGIAVSLKKNVGLENVQAYLKSLVATHDTGIRYLLTARQASLVQKAVDSLAQAKEACLASLALDAAAIDIYDAQRALAGILSAENRDAVIDEVFRSFCLGK
jgi:tRNA modification GTPase